MDGPPERLTGTRVVQIIFVALLLFGGTGSAVSPAAAQQTGAAAHVDWSVAADPAEVAIGSTFDVVIRAEIADGWKMYAIDSPPPTRGVEITFDDLPQGFSRTGDVQQAEPVQTFDPNFKMEVRLFEDQARFRAPIAVSQQAEGGRQNLAGTAAYMICNDRLCLPPTTHEFTVPVSVAAASGGAEITGGDARTSPVRAAGSALGGIWTFLLVAAGAGLAALLTPCVFPMIPLTVSYFTKHSGDRADAARMAGVYGLTIVLTFTGIGVAAAIFLGAAGAQSIAADPWINLSIGLIFIVFALSLLGLFELRLPTGWLNYFNRQSTTRGGYLGVFFMGLTLTLVSFSCTAPFVGGLLVATTQGTWTYPIFGMLVFSSVFALPFVAFALFPHGLEALPRSGGWMSAVKVTLGFVELAAALKFLSNADLVWGWGLLSRPLVIALSVVIFLMAGLYLLGKLPLKHEPIAEKIGVARLMASIAFLGFALYLLPGLFGGSLGALDAYLPPRSAAATTGWFSGADGSGEHLTWHEDIERAFARADQEGKPVFIDFTGYTCTNCREMEANVFPRPPVRSRLQNDFVRLRLYTDDAQKGPALQDFQMNLTGTVALPTYAIVEPQGRNVLAQWSGIATTEEFARFLQRGTSAFGRPPLAFNAPKR